MDINQKRISYNIELAEGETIEIKINGNPAFNEAVPVGYITMINFIYQEEKVKEV